MPEPIFPAPAPQKSSDDITGLDESRLYAMMSYLTVLVLIPLLMKRDDPFVRFHAQQGLIMLLALILSLIAAAWAPVIGNALFLLLLILDVIALVQALLGRRWRIPVIGTIAHRFKM